MPDRPVQIAASVSFFGDAVNVAPFVRMTPRMNP
jgi:hypothetical protein